MDDAMEHITSDHDDFVDAVVYRGSVTTGDFGLRIGEIVTDACKYNIPLF